MVLFFPQLKFKNVSVSGLYLFVAFFFIQFDNAFAIIRTLAFDILLIIGYGLALVGIIQLACIFHMHLRVAVYCAIAQQLVNHTAQYVQRTHGHRVADGVGARATQLKHALLVELCIGIGLYHRGMVKCIGCTWAQVDHILEVTFNAEVYRTLNAAVIGVIVLDYLQQPRKNLLAFVGIIPNSRCNDVGYLGQEYGVGVDEALAQERQDVANGFKT